MAANDENHEDDVRRLTSELLAGPASVPGVPAVADAWDALAGSGLPLVGVPEDAGGSGGTLRDAAVVLGAAAESGFSLPLPETAWLAGHVAALVGAELDDGPATVVPDGAPVVWGGVVRTVFVLQPDEVRMLTRADGGGDDALGLPRGELDLGSWIEVGRYPLPADLREDLALRLAAARTVQIAGAARSTAALARQHATERVQFGRRLAQFQVIQHYLARLAIAAHAVSTAAGLAVEALEQGGPDAAAEIRSAKAVASETVEEITELAHQVVGAIGTTREHVLHRRTMNLWAWRDDAGDEFTHGAALSDLRGGTDLWEFVTAGSAR